MIHLFFIIHARIVETGQLENLDNLIYWTCAPGVQ